MSQHKIVRFSQATEKTGLSRSTIYDLISKDQFPKQIKLSPRTAGFLESELDQWLEDRAANRSA